MKKTYLYTNNHFSAKSVANAAMIKQQLGEPLEGDTRRSSLERYPEIAGDWRSRRCRTPRLAAHVHLHDLVACLKTRRHVLAGDDLAEDGVLAVQVGPIARA